MKMTETWDLKDKATHFLSYGQKKRVSIAGVLAMNPEIIVLDEPTAGLDPVFTRQIMEILDELNQKGRTIIISSHNMEEVYAWADYIFVLSQGEIIAQGKTIELFKNDQAIKKANLFKPWVLEVFNKISDSLPSWKKLNIPRKKDQLMTLIEEEIKID